MAKAVKAELKFKADKATGSIEIALLHDGAPVGSIVYSLAEAEAFTRQLAEAIIALNDAGPRQKPSLILPERVN